MQCPKCRKMNTESADYCMQCGAPLSFASGRGSGQRLKGDLAAKRSSGDKAPVMYGASFHHGDEGKNSTENVSRVRKASDRYRSDEYGFKAVDEKGDNRGFRYCKKCGRRIAGGEEYCSVCGVGMGAGAAKNGVNSKLWIGIASVIAVVLLVVGISFAANRSAGEGKPAAKISTSLPSYSEISSPPDNEISGLPDSEENKSVSEGLYTLCRGTDASGNTYELVADQKESAFGYEITVGVVKNNSWIYPLSTDFPFLGEDGLFHVSVSLAGESGTSLSQLNTVIDKIYFIDSGAFLLDCYKANNSLSIYDHMYIIFSCSSLESYVIDCSKSTLLYLCSEPEFESGKVKSYGQIYTDNGDLIMYSETSGTISGWLEDRIFEWRLLNTESLNSRVIASEVKGIRPACVLSEGLFLCTDRCFYDLNAQKTIDLSNYNIDTGSPGICFDEGKCMFKAENNLGTEFLITIDKSGNVLSEATA